MTNNVNYNGDFNLNSILFKIEQLYNKYDGMPHIQEKLLHHVNHILPLCLENTNIIHMQREERKKSLTDGSDEFIDMFLAKYNFCYNDHMDLFFNQKYEIIKEDDIQYLILSSITKHHTHLLPWKYKIKTSLIKRIRNNLLLKSIPSEDTIHNIISIMHPSMFYTTYDVKYFLTVLGDILNKKNNELIYFLMSKTFIPILKDMNQECCNYFGINLMTHFKFKFYEHNIKDCRIINVCEQPNSTFFNLYIKKDILHLFIVASHYSFMHHSADQFIETCPTKIKHALYLKMNTEDEIINEFLTDTTDVCSGYNIIWKNILFLWKIFIEDKKIPNVFFNNSLKIKLISLGIYDNDNDWVTNRISKHLPLVNKFITFWNTYIIINETEGECVLGVEHILALFNAANAMTITDKMMLILIRHYYTDVIIECDKFLINVELRKP